MDLKDELIKAFDWLTDKNNPFAICYGSDTRFATIKKDFTTEQVVDKYLSSLPDSGVEKVPITKEHKDLKKLVLDEYKKGNIVVITFEGLATMPLKECLKQPIEGLLYDINRDTGTILTFLDDPKWINDYALTRIVIELIGSNQG